MQNDKICSDIVSALARTRSEANLLLSEVDSLMRSLFIVGPNDFNGTLQKDVRARIALMMSTVPENEREQFLTLLKEKIEALNYLNLIIAFEPNLEIIGQLSSWVKQNVGSDVAMDITINKSILGGAIIEYKGRVYSHTILSGVEDYFLNNVNF